MPRSTLTTSDPPARRRVVDGFRSRWGAPPAIVVRSPGRVNLIGEHTDYNNGFVLPMAIDRAIWIALRPREDGRVVAGALDIGGSVEFAVPRPARGGPPWGEYLKGIAWVLGDAGYPVAGWEGVLAGEVPVGAGLSSSAALEIGTARAFAAVAAIPWEPLTMARIAQRAENEWVGVPCGIMDPLIVAAGEQGHALLIDCRTYEQSAVPLPDALAVVVMDTGTRRGLVGSGYEDRRAQCEAAARHFGVVSLRDLEMEVLERGADDIEDVVYRRARHVVSENARTLRFAQALRAGDVEEAGRLMNASHRSLRDDFEVSTPELDAMVEAARSVPGCAGARLTGAGFGGCAVALVWERELEAFTRLVVDDFRRATGREATLYACRPAAGADVES
jgi:galactokinase